MSSDLSPTVLISGLRSVGKSSFVSVLWGDAELAPTAVRDCTQTNTLVRVPAAGESDCGLWLHWLPRDRALEFASRDLSFHRLAQFLTETLGPAAPRLDEMGAEARLRAAPEAVERLFRERPELAVLHEPLSDDLERVREFLAFVESPAFHPGARTPAEWGERQEWLMGRRRPDGRLFDVGRLLALRRVELVRSSEGWGGAPPRLIDTPWIPAFHNARRAELIVDQAREADALIVVAHPEPLEPEPWLLQVFRERPELTRRTLLLFNQIDGVDPHSLFTRGGCAEVFDGNAQRLQRLGLDPENLFVGCTRLPFLKVARKDAFLEERAAKLGVLLQRMAERAAGHPEGLFKRRLLAACDPQDCGVETLRRRMIELTRVRK